MIGRIWAVALNTFREASRGKVVWAMAALVVAVNLFALVLGSISLHEEARIARDAGLAGVSLFGALTAIVIGVSLLHTEMKRRTIHVILAKPLEHHEFVVGKYLGMALSLTLLVAFFAGAMVLLLWLADTPVTASIAQALILAWMQVLLVAALAVFFSSFAAPYLSGVFTFAVFFLGRVWPEIHWAADRAREEWIRTVAAAALYLVPDLHLFTVSGSEVGGKPVSVHGNFVGWGYVGQAGLYAAACVGVLLLLAILIFRRRDFV